MATEVGAKCCKKRHRAAPGYIPLNSERERNEIRLEKERQQM